ncbi:hypothetical protein U472_15220 [Orenia metallireducens]|jgi:uncharacterized membrane protein (DUF441 family)|uniref:UPF0756 membrane protein U472_15220 n=1 Tax=Orenia metallireducens TaxID=1413210 RepID=A0A1C0A6D7_9FIRM|nr:DUF441 domain-containing protein [Orenia metallireducens]OCL25679.1 hypothetical protein U472_15220 [Orenia metallireducens]
MQVNLILGLILFLGLIAKNNSLIISGIVLLAVRLLKADQVLNIIDNYSVKIGIILIMLGVLTPLATGDLKLEGITENILNPVAILALVMGIAVTQFTREGLWLMENKPTVTINLVSGVILGVAFFKGVPSGPLIASGITAVIYKLISLFL